MDKFDMIDAMTDSEVSEALRASEHGSRYYRALVVEETVRAHRTYCPDYQKDGQCNHKFAMHGDDDAIRL